MNYGSLLTAHGLLGMYLHSDVPVSPRRRLEVASVRRIHLHRSRVVLVEDIVHATEHTDPEATNVGIDLGTNRRGGPSRRRCPR